MMQQLDLFGAAEPQKPAPVKTPARNAPGVIIRGRLERKDTVVNLIAEVIEPLPIPVRHRSRDFR